MLIFLTEVTKIHIMEKVLSEANELWSMNLESNAVEN